MVRQDKWLQNITLWYQRYQDLMTQYASLLRDVNWVQWAPWRRYKDAVEVDGDLPEGISVEERVEAQNRGINN